MTPDELKDAKAALDAANFFLLGQAVVQNSPLAHRHERFKVGIVGACLLEGGTTIAHSKIDWLGYGEDWPEALRTAQLKVRPGVKK